jgi:putative transcriptional regulator
MPIRIELDLLLAQRKMHSKELADAIGITPVNLSILKTGKAKAIRFATLAALCRVLECQPGDILRYEPGDADEEADDG